MSGGQGLCSCCVTREIKVFSGSQLPPAWPGTGLGTPQREGRYSFDSQGSLSPASSRPDRIWAEKITSFPQTSIFLTCSRGGLEVQKNGHDLSRGLWSPSTRLFPYFHIDLDLWGLGSLEY